MTRNFKEAKEECKETNLPSAIETHFSNEQTRSVSRKSEDEIVQDMDEAKQEEGKPNKFSRRQRRDKAAKMKYKAACGKLKAEHVAMDMEFKNDLHDIMEKRNFLYAKRLKILNGLKNKNGKC